MAGRSVKRSPPDRRLVLLMPLAAWTVHQVRYLAAYGSGAPRQLADQGHAYLDLVMPVILVLASLAFGAFVLRFARAWSREGNQHSATGSTSRLWVTIAAGLVAIYTGQELLEGVLASGHAPGLAGVLGNGGWWALPAAVMVAGLLAFAVRGARVVEALLGRRVSRRRRISVAPMLPMPLSAALSPAAPLARRGAGRAPPAAFAVS